MNKQHTINQTVGLVIDNPERDLEGLVLLGAHLVKMGFSVLLIPFYKQRYVAKTEKIDVLVLNYLRPNNLDVFFEYKRQAIKVAVLDSEGNSRQSVDKFADFVLTTNATHLLDLYMFWGVAQMQAVHTKTSLLPRKTIVTGCPRYDFFAKPWNKCFEFQKSERDFILINTNFPLVNPKFSTGRNSEYKTLIRNGIEPSYALATQDECMSAYQGMKKLITTLAEAFPDQTFVIRPHPFEAVSGYRNLNRFGNIKVIQSASANSWIKMCKCLIHLNCTTAIEASLMGKLVLSPGWLNNQKIFRSLPQALSHVALHAEEIIEILRSQSKQKSLNKNLSARSVRKKIKNYFHKIDGNAAKRAAIEICALSHLRNEAFVEKKLDFRKYIKSFCLNIFELPIFWQLKEKIQKIRKSKYFSGDDVVAILQRLKFVEPTFQVIAVAEIRRIKGFARFPSDLVALKLESSKEIESRELKIP